MFYLRFVPLILALLYILLQKAEIKVKKRDKITVNICFTLFSITLSDFDKSKGRFRSLSKLLSKIKVYIGPVKYLVGRSTLHITIYESSDNLVSLNPMINAGNIALRQIVFSLIDSFAKSFTLDVSGPVYSDTTHTSSGDFDAAIQFSLYQLIYSALFLLYIILKNKLKRAITNV